VGTRKRVGAHEARGKTSGASPRHDRSFHAGDVGHHDVGLGRARKSIDQLEDGSRWCREHHERTTGKRCVHTRRELGDRPSRQGRTSFFGIGCVPDHSSQTGDTRTPGNRAADRAQSDDGERIETPVLNGGSLVVWTAGGSVPTRNPILNGTGTAALAVAKRDGWSPLGVLECG
jgi:hypothetical protein